MQTKRLDIYPARLVFIRPDEIEKARRRLGEDLDTFPVGSAAFSQSFGPAPGTYFTHVIVVDLDAIGDDMAALAGYLAHEAVHVAATILETCGIEARLAQSEVDAYLVGCITKWLWSCSQRASSTR